ncbi:MAG: hypothetical protein AAB870_04210 [Patescibacteria group bacterium]
MLSTPPLVQEPRTPEPNLIARRFRKRNVVVVLVGLCIFAVIVAGIIIGSSQLLFLFPQKTTPEAVVPSEEPVAPVPTPTEEVIGDVVVPKAVGEDNFYLKPADFDATGMGTQSEIVLTSKVDMDTKAVLFHLVLDPVFAYDVVSVTPREIRIKPKDALLEAGIYHFRLPTSYKDGDRQVTRLYKWGYEARHSSGVSQTISGYQMTNTAALQQIVQDMFGLYPEQRPLNTAPPLNEDQNRTVLSLSLNQPIPFDQLPLASSIDVYILSHHISSLWQRALQHFQERDDVHSVISSHIMESLFERVATGNSSLITTEVPSASQESASGKIPVPYPANDFSITELLALIAYSDPTWLPVDDLTIFFESVYFAADATASQRAQAAFGLASLGKPFLQEQVNLLNDTRLRPIDRLYLGLGLDRMGATEYTVVVYNDILKDHKARNHGGSFIQTLESPLQNQYATLLTALAGFTFDREDSDLRGYLNSIEGGNGTMLHALYLTKRIEREAVDVHSFEMSHGGIRSTVVLDDIHRMLGQETDVVTLRRMAIQGDRTGLDMLIAF